MNVSMKQFFFFGGGGGGGGGGRPRLALHYIILSIVLTMGKCTNDLCCTQTTHHTWHENAYVHLH